MSKTIPDFQLDLAPQDGSPEDETQPKEEKKEDLLQDQDHQEEEKVEEQSSGSDPNAVALYEFYSDKGYLPKVEDFDGSFDTLEQLLLAQREGETDQVLQGLVESVPDFVQPILELAFTKGKEMSMEDLQQVLSLSTQPEISRESIEKDEDQAEKYIRAMYDSMEYTKEQADEMIDMMKDNKILQKTALGMFDKDDSLRVKKLEGTLDQAKARKDEIERQNQAFHDSFVQSIDELKWSDDRKQIVYSELKTENFKKRLEHMMRNPDFLPYLIDFVSYYDGKNLDLGSYKKQAFSPTVKKVKEETKNYWNNTISKGNETQDDSNLGDLSNYRISLE